MKDQAKNLADTLSQALHEKGIELPIGAGLDVTAKLLGVKDWNALSAVVSERRQTGHLQRAVRVLLAAMAELASQAGDVSEWNRGGFAYEACQIGKKTLRGPVLPLEACVPQCAAQTQNSSALLAFAEELAATPLEGEFCAEAPQGIQSWEDLASTYSKVEATTLRARQLLRPQEGALCTELVAKVRAVAPDGALLDDLVLDLAESYAAQVANMCTSEYKQEEAFNAWSDKASRINNMGLGIQVQFLLDGYGAEETQRLIEEALSDAAAARSC